MTNNHKNMLNEIENLYRVVDEVFSEYERLSKKMADSLENGELISEKEHEQYKVYEHLTRLYTGC